MFKLNRMIVWVVCLVASVSALFLTMQFATLGAFAAPSTCNELQLIFLVDQSGSMRGNSAHPVVNDPLKLRFEGPKHAVERIGILRYTQYPTMTVRFALVNFGTAAEVGIDWTSIAAANDAQWTQQWGMLSQALAPGKWDTADMGNTNFVGAFEKAGELFNRLPQQIGNCPTRAVIVLTDGRPQLPDLGFSMPDHFAKLQKFVDTSMPLSAYNIYVIAMSQDAFWNETESYWLKVTGNQKKDNIKTGLVNDDKEIGDRFAKIIQEWLPRPLQCFDPARGTIIVPPFLQQVSFTLYKATSQPNHLRIEDERGIIEPSRTDIKTTIEGFNGPIETVRVVGPLPGVWRIKTNLPVEKCDIQMLPIPANGNLLTPAVNRGSLRQFSQFDVSFQITDSAGNPLPEYGPAYPLQIKASVNDVSGIDVLNALPDGKNKFTAPYIPIEPGAHTIDLLATSRDAEGKTIEIVKRQIGAFTIEPVKLTVSAGPTAGSRIQQYAPISTTLALVAGADNKSVTITLPVNITANLFVADKSQSLPLVAGTDGAWTGTVTPQQTGLHRIQYAGSVTLSDGTKKELGKSDISFNVSAATLLKPQVLKPAQPVFEGTNFLGQPNGLVFEVQIVDATGKMVEPSQVVEGSNDQVFKLGVTDSSRRDRSAELVLQRTAQPGVYRAEAKNFGADDYTIRILPAANLKPDFVWGDKAWTYNYKGTLNMGVFGLLAIAGLILLDIGQWVGHTIAARPNPFRRGTLVIARREVSDPDAPASERDVDESLKVMWQRALPSSSNFARFLNGWAWRGVIPWHHQEFEKRLNIRKIEVRNLETQQSRGNRISGKVQAKVVYSTKAGTASKEYKLSRGGVESAAELPLFGYIMYLRDPRANQE